MEPHTKVTRHEVQETSVNSIFALTGPTAGVLHIRSALELPNRDTLEENEMIVINDCFDTVAVPADQYWRAASQHQILLHSSLTNDDLSISHPSFSISTNKSTLTVKRPDPSDIPNSFYTTRLDAISKRCYDIDQGMILIAADNRNGTSGKMFNILKREELPSFVESIPLYHYRNLYVLVDENVAIDPFFDIDCHPPYDWIEEDVIMDENKKITSSNSFKVTTTIIEGWLKEILDFLRNKIEEVTGVQLQHCVVLTSSVIIYDDVDDDDDDDDDDNNNEKKKDSNKIDKEETDTGGSLSSSDSKLSFHVHFRLNNNTVFSNVKEFQKFMSSLCDELDKYLLQPINAETARLYRMLRRCIDFGVYTRWRAFRLPYNVKMPSPTYFSPVDVAGLDLMILTLSQSDVKVVNIPNVHVGGVSSSVAHVIDFSLLKKFSSRVQRHQYRRLVSKLFFFFRFLLPVVPGITNIVNKDLSEFLFKYSPYFSKSKIPEEKSDQLLANVVFDFANIQRYSSKEGEGENNGVSTLHPITAESLNNKQKDSSVTDVASHDPFFVPRPPYRDGVRVPIRDLRVKDLVAEVYRCLSAVYNGDKNGNDLCATATRIIGERITVQYQDSIRAYYAQQKLSRYCLNLDREHRETYPQLYLTYGSIKLRCYSNDCCRRCLAVKWSSEDDEKTSGSAAILLSVNKFGYPKYERLAEIRNLLFPPLPPEELVKRYGVSSLE